MRVRDTAIKARGADAASAGRKGASGIRKAPILCLLGAFVLAAALRPGRPETELFGEEDAMAVIQGDMRPIETAGDGYPESVRKYFAHYGLGTTEGVRHRFGTFESGEWTLAAHIFEPAEYRGTVILLHGYLNHSGQFRHLVRRLVSEGYAVAMYDMPGHGLSTGDRAAIDDFSEYTDVLGDFVEVVERLTHGPVDVIGFSTGGTVVIDWLLTRDDTVFRRAVLAAPLVRIKGWRSSMAAARFYGNFADRVPRMPRKNSSDKEYLRFNRRHDVLHQREVSLRWVRALYEWNERMEEREQSGRRVKVVQGTKDKTVDYEYNLGFIGSKFSTGNLAMIEGAEHELFNEIEQLRKEALDAIITYLNAAGEDEAGAILFGPDGRATVDGREDRLDDDGHHPGPPGRRSNG